MAADASPSTAAIDPAGGSLRDFAHGRPQRVEERAANFEAWRSGRENAGYWPYAKYLLDPPRASTTLQHSDGSRYSGINLATQDYLSPSTHVDVKAAAVAATERFGVHSAGSTALAGNVHESLALEASISNMLQMKHVLPFDVLAHNCLQEGAMAATRNVHRTRHLDVDQARSTLAAIREKDAANTVLVVTEGIFSMDADAPDLRTLQCLCRQYGATLVVDVAHDFGCTGPGGTGEIGLQGMLGEVDIVMGSFQDLCRQRRIRCDEQQGGQRVSALFRSALPFLQCLVAGAGRGGQYCISIIRSQEGDVLRERLSAAVAALRNELSICGFDLLGKPHAIVPMIVGTEAVGRRGVLAAAHEGVLVNLAEFPVVPTDPASACRS